MPTLPRAPCMHPGCPRRRNATTKYCDDHAPDYAKLKKIQNRQRVKYYGSRYNSRRWRSLRNVVLRRDQLCQCDLTNCNHEPYRCGKQATEVDHRIAIESGGTNDLDNLRGLCKQCHSRKTARHDGGFNPKNKTRMPTDDGGGGQNR